MKKKWLWGTLIVVGVLGSAFVVSSLNKKEDKPKVEYSYQEVDLPIEFEETIENKETDFASFHGMYGNELLYMVLDKSNGFTYATKGLYSFNVDTKEVKILKKMDGTKRIVDFCVRDDVIYYSVWTTTKEGIDFEIVVEKDGIENVIDSGNTLGLSTMPSFYNLGKISYLKIDIENDDSTTMTSSYIEIKDDYSLDVVWENKTPKVMTPQPDGEEYLGTVYRNYNKHIKTFFTVQGNECTIHYFNKGIWDTFKVESLVQSIYILDSQIIVNGDMNYDLETKTLTKDTNAAMNNTIHYTTFNDDTLVYSEKDENIHIREYEGEKYNDIILPDLSTRNIRLFNLDNDRVVICYEPGTSRTINPLHEKIYILTREEK